MKDSTKIAAQNTKIRLHREYDLKLRSRSLKARLWVRPNEYASLKELIDISYECGNYVDCNNSIKHLISIDKKLNNNSSGSLYLRLGRSLFMLWKEEKDIDYLLQAVKAYQNAMKDKNINTLRYYGIGAQIIKDLNVKNMILISRSRKKIIGLDGFGLKIKKQIIIK